MLFTLALAGCTTKVLGLDPYMDLTLESFTREGPGVACEDDRYVVLRFYSAFSPEEAYGWMPTNTMFFYDKKTSQVKYLRNLRSAEQYGRGFRMDHQEWQYVDDFQRYARWLSGDSTPIAEKYLTFYRLAFDLAPEDDKAFTTNALNETLKQAPIKRIDAIFTTEERQVKGSFQLYYSDGRETGVELPCIVADMQKLPPWIQDRFHREMRNSSMLSSLYTSASNALTIYKKNPNGDKATKAEAMAGDLFLKHAFTIRHYRSPRPSDIKRVALALASGKSGNGISTKNSVTTKKVTTKLKPDAKSVFMFMEVWPASLDGGFADGSVVAFHHNPALKYLGVMVNASPGPEHAKLPAETPMCELRKQIGLWPNAPCFVVTKDAVYEISWRYDEDQNAVLSVTATGLVIIPFFVE